LVEALSRESVAGHLWIIEPGRIRIHESPEKERRCGLPPADEFGLATVQVPNRAGGSSLTMEPRRVPVDWDELELALEMRSDEWASYVDLRTGEVRVSRIDRFDGEREDHELTDEEVEAGLADSTLVAVEPLESSVEYAWMADFADAVPDARVRRALQLGLGGGRPFRRFKDALAAHPRECEQWFAFRAERLRDAVREWLADHSIEPTTEPPARSGHAPPSGAP
jgi:hypothetical protein